MTRSVGGAREGVTIRVPAGPAREIHVTLVQIRRGDSVRLGFDADDDVMIWRDEIRPDDDRGRRPMVAGPAG